jgi:MFS transporter, UMF1 family
MVPVPASKTIFNKQTLSWALFDWANSAFATVILTFVFATYFTKSVMSDPIEATSVWSYTLAASGFLLAFLAPFCGAIADLSGRLKFYTLTSLFVAILAIACLWFASPAMNPESLIWILLALAIANISFELALIFYNAFLPHISKRETLGQVSSLGWAFGYFGGLLCLAFVLFGFIGLGDIKPLFPMSQAESEHVRISTLVVALWMFVFSIPFLFFMPTQFGHGKKDQNFFSLLHQAVQALKQTLIGFKQASPLRSFLIGSALYRDGLNTLFAMGGIYAATRYDMEMSQILLFGIAMNVSAGIGCVLASFLEDRIGSLKVIRLSLVCLIISILFIIVTQDVQIFWILALFLGLFIGPVQSASRSMIVHIAHTQNQGARTGELFGLYALAGRAVAFLGPLMFGLLTDVFNTPQAGLASLIFLWLIGLIFIRSLKQEG